MRDRGTESLHGVLTIEVIRQVNHYSRDVPRQDGTRLGECRLIVILALWSDLRLGRVRLDPGLMLHRHELGGVRKPHPNRR